jgi:hypothetical protein
LETYKATVEKHVDTKLGESEFIDGENWEDWTSDRTLDAAKQAGKPAVVSEIQRVLNRPINRDTRESINDYLDSFGKLPISQAQHAEKIADRWAVLKDDAASIVAEKLGRQD